MAEKRLLMLVAMEMIVRVNVEKVKCMQLNLALVLGGLPVAATAVEANRRR